MDGLIAIPSPWSSFEAPEASTSKRQLSSTASPESSGSSAGFEAQQKKQKHSAGSGNPSAAQAPRQKRRQYVACDPCRLRRVKCERDSEDEPCRGCIKRGFNCSKEYNTAKASEARSGRLLDQAKALYGANDAPQEPSNAFNGATNGMTGFGTSDLGLLRPTISSQESPLFAYDSAEGRLGLIQSNEFVVNDLIHAYKECLLGQNPIMSDFSGFVERFEQCGRRLMTLSPDDKAVGTIILALAGRITDMPLIAGSSSPALKSFADGAIDTEVTDLTVFGQNREATCRALEQRARSMVERTFFRREATVDSINALMAQQEIEDVDENETGVPIPRIYSAAAIEQLRTIAAKPVKSQLESFALVGPLVKSVLLTDAMWGFVTGRPFQVTDDDLVLLYPKIFKQTPAEAAQISPSATGKEISLALLDQMIMLARKMRQTLTSPVARLRNVSPSADFFRQNAADLAALLGCVRTGLTRGPLDRHTTQSLRAIQSGFTMQHAWLQWQNQVAIEKTADPAKKAELQASLREIQPSVYKAITEMADSCRDLYQEGMLLGRNLLWSSLSQAAEIAFKLPVNTEGGPPHFTLERKLECAENFIRCVRLLAFSWPASARQLPDLEHKLSVLRAQYFLETGRQYVSPGKQAAVVPSSIQEIGIAPSGLDWLLDAQPTVDFSSFLAAPVPEVSSFGDESSADVDSLLRSLMS